MQAAKWKMLRTTMVTAEKTSLTFKGQGPGALAWVITLKEAHPNPTALSTAPVLVPKPGGQGKMSLKVSTAQNIIFNKTLPL